MNEDMRSKFNLFFDEAKGHASTWEAFQAGAASVQGEQCPSELREALVAAIAWIDAVPTYTDLPTMPGFDRDWVDGLLAAQPKEPT